MELTIEKDVNDYLNKHNSQCIIVDALLQETNSGCSCGVTKKYYTHYIRVGKNSKPKSDEYNKYDVDGIDVFIMKKALLNAEDRITIYLEKTLFIKKLSIKGLTISIL